MLILQSRIKIMYISLEIILIIIKNVVLNIPLTTTTSYKPSFLCLPGKICKYLNRCDRTVIISGALFVLVFCNRRKLKSIPPHQLFAVFSIGCGCIFLTLAGYLAFLEFKMTWAFKYEKRKNQV